MTVGSHFEGRAGGLRLSTSQLLAMCVCGIALLLSPIARAQPLSGLSGGQSEQSSAAPDESRLSDVTRVLDALGNALVRTLQPDDQRPTVESPRWNSLESPRHTIHTFVEAMSHALEGKEQAWPRALKTMDFKAGYSEQEQRQAAEHLYRVLQRLGELQPRDIADEQVVDQRRLQRYRFFPQPSQHAWVWQALDNNAPEGEIVLVTDEDDNWLFSAATVAGVNELYESMKSLPPRTSGEQQQTLGGMFSPTIEQTSLGGWLCLLVGVIGGVLIALLLRWGCRRLAGALQRRGRPLFGTLMRDIASPLALLVATLGLALGALFVHLDPVFSRLRWRAVEVLLVITVVWMMFNLVNVAAYWVERCCVDTDRRTAELTMPLIRRALRIAIVVLLALFLLQNLFSMNVAAFLAGIGLIGLALSLAAKESFQNVLGTLTIVFDRPFEKEDWIEYEDELGEVIDIGFRSTRLRLLNGDALIIPNMHFIDRKVQNLFDRPYIRRTMNLHLPLDTPPATVDHAMQIVESVLRDDEVVSDGQCDLEDRPPIVSFNEFNDWSLNIIAYYWYFMSSGGARVQRDSERGWFSFLEHATLINRRIVEAFADADIEMALPARSLRLSSDQKRGLRLDESRAPEADNGDGDVDNLSERRRDQRRSTDRDRAEVPAGKRSAQSSATDSGTVDGSGTASGESDGASAGNGNGGGDGRA